MLFSPMKIAGAWVVEPNVFADNRGSFNEVFRFSDLAKTLGIEFEVRQVNQSVSAAGVIRGIHWADVPPGQAKFVSCISGALWDVVVDLRENSKTFGEWDAVEISADNKKSVLISQGLGHAFLSLKNDSVANYLVTSEYDPQREHELNPFDKNLNIDFGRYQETIGVSGFLLSSKDQNAPGLRELIAAGKLPK